MIFNIEYDTQNNIEISVISASDDLIVANLQCRGSGLLIVLTRYYNDSWCFCEPVAYNVGCAISKYSDWNYDALSIIDNQIDRFIICKSISFLLNDFYLNYIA